MKKFHTAKRIALVTLVIALMLTFAACSGTSSSDDDYDYDYDDVYVPPVSPYVTMVKDATNSNYGITYEKAFNAFFANPEWSYFKATSGEHVVEFEGEFSYDNAPATATIQFVVDVDEGTFSAYHLSINGVDQSRLMLATLIQKVFESY